MKLLLVVAVLLCVAQSQARDYRTQHDVATLKRGYPYPFPPGPPYGRKNDDTDVVPAKQQHNFVVLRFFSYIDSVLSYLSIKLQQFQIISQLFGWSNLARYLGYCIKLLKLFIKNTEPILHQTVHYRERYPPECESKDPRPECHGYPR